MHMALDDFVAGPHGKMDRIKVDEEITLCGYAALATDRPTENQVNGRNCVCKPMLFLDSGLRTAYIYVLASG